MPLAWRLAHREVRRRPGRTVLVVLLIALTVGGLVMGDVAYRSRQTAPGNALGAAAQKVSVRLADGDSRDAQQMLQDHMTAPGATTVRGWEVGGLPVQRADRPGLGLYATLWTVDAADPLLAGALRLHQGRLPAAADEVLLGRGAASTLRVAVGDTLALARPDEQFRVVGIGDVADGNGELFLAPGYPVEQLRTSARTAVMYSDTVVPPGANFSSTPAEAQANISWQVPPTAPGTDYGELLLGWLAATLLLAVLGIVVAAAFAASGRRQLVTLGQLGATGADAGLARRFLALQGSITGLLGATAGVALGLLGAWGVGDPVVHVGRWNVVWADLLVIVVTTVVVATCAALLPTRALAEAPVLTALSGRAPVAAVRPGQLRMGVLGIVFGLVVLGMSVAAARGSTGEKATAAVALALASAGAVLAGVCALSPMVVDRWGRVGTHLHGSGRLAVRSMVRHRARSAALVAAIAAVGAVGVAGASGIERWSQLREITPIPSRLDVLTIGNLSVPDGSSRPDSDVSVRDAWRADVESVVGPVQWHELRYAIVDPTQGDFLVADDETLAALGVPASMFAAIRSTDTNRLVRTGTPESIVPVIRVPGLALVDTPVVTPEAARRDAWTPTRTVLLGVAPAPLTDVQRQQLTVVTYSKTYDGYFFGNTAAPASLDPGNGVWWEQPYSGPVVTRTAVRWMIIGALLLLVALIVGTGLALWAAEGKAERDQLVAVGAPPRSLAGMAGVRAWVLATTGGVMAVPLGTVTLWVVLHAADTSSPFPKLTAVMVAVVLPLVVGVVSFVGSALAQHWRPVTGATMSLD
ncbi:MAG: hypothetical protein RJA49_78 [Actinomycetota bacterium]